MQPIESLKSLKQINFDYYSAAHMAHQQGKFIAYVNAFTPVELAYAMNMIPIYPENHAAIIGARRQTVEVAQAAENMGLQSVRTLAILFDGVARHTQEGLDFVKLAGERGFRDAVRQRDEPFGDYGSGSRSRRRKA